jgi:DNA-binding NarL/FixJ family response regulator
MTRGHSGAWARERRSSKRGPLQKAAVLNPIVLIVEDHAALRAVLPDWIRGLVPGVSVLSVGCVEDALDTVTRTGADVVLMDIGLPGVNGIEGTRLIRARAPQTAVVMLSILDDRAHVADAMGAGAAAFVSKRRMRSELPAVLQAVLGRQAGAKSASEGS